MKKENLRRNGLTIMANLILILGNLAFIMIFAVINGSLGYLCAMGVTIFGALGIAKFLGETISLSYNAIIAFIIGCGVVRGLLRYFEQYFNHYIAFRLLAVLRDKIFGALRVLAPAKLESKKKGSIISMITSDIETLEVFYAHTISPICIAILVSTCLFIFTGIISSWYLAIIELIGFITIGIIIPIISSNKLKESGVNYRREFSSFSAYFLDSIKGINDIVLNNASDSRKKEVEKRSDILLDETRKMKKETAKSTAFTETSVSIFIFLSLFIGIILINKGMLTVGSMIAGVVTVFGSFGPVIAISALPGNLTQTFASGDRVLDLLSEKPVVSPIENGKNFEFETLSIKDLSFSYDKEKNILSDISLDLKQGEIVGIIGKSGCGKSTLLKLLLRFWEKDEGSILYNGIDIDNINSNNLLDNVTLVSQTTYLFEDTIENNIKIAKADATKEEIEEACKMASIHDFITSLPNGYQTIVGSSEDNLSAGEKQRIGLARSFISGAKLILLDEPTSNVDSINEGIILKALKSQKNKKSIILVSHRESTMSIADKIYSIKDGKIAKSAC